MAADRQEQQSGGRDAPDPTIELLQQILEEQKRTTHFLAELLKAFQTKA